MRVSKNNLMEGLHNTSQPCSLLPVLCPSRAGPSGKLEVIA